MEAIIIIHGTFASGSSKGKNALPLWWQRGGAFCESLDRTLSEAGSSSRCWLHLSTCNTENPSDGLLDSEGPSTTNRQRVAEFQWTGSNSEAARRDAALELRSYLCALESDARLHRYHIVAHSHGGNVLAHALAGLGFRAGKLGTIIFLGTPFLHFGTQVERKWFWPLMILLVICMCISLFGALTQIPIPLENWPTALFFGLSLILAASSMPILAWRYRPRPWKRVLSGAVRKYFLLFERDEAFAALAQCVSIRRHPLQFVRTILGGRITPPFRQFTSLVRGKSPYVGNPAKYLFQVLFFRRPRTQESPRSHSVLAAMAATLVYSIAFVLLSMALDKFIRPHVPTLIKVGLLLVWAYIFGRMLDLLFGWIPWLYALIIRFGLVIGVRAGADTALGIDAGGAFQGVATEPRNESLERVELPTAVEDQAITLVCEAASRTARRLYNVSGGDHIEALAEQVRKTLSDATLLHAQYYQHPRVVSLIADCISGRRASVRQ